MDYIIENESPKYNYNLIRTLIRNFIDNGGMKVTEFQRHIGVNINAYRNFMALSEPYKGENSSVYVNACAFFRKREMKGVPMPKKAKTVPAVEGEKSTTTAKGKKRGPTLTDFGGCGAGGRGA